MTLDDLIPSVWPTRAAMCAALGITKGAASQWAQKGIPKMRQYQIREVMRRMKKRPARSEAAA